MEQLTKTQVYILAGLWYAALYSSYSAYEVRFSHDYIMDAGTDDWHVSDYVQGDRKKLSAELKVLRELGYVEYERGLMSEDGEVGGAGNGLAQAKYDEVYEYLEQKGIIE